MESFDNIYLDLSKQPGKCKFADSGLGWKPHGGGDTFTLDAANIAQGHWSRAARGYELKVLLRQGTVIQLDGFEQEDFDRLSKTFKAWYSVSLENKEHALRGWNWGRVEFQKAELTFNVQNRPAFEIPYTEVLNTNLAGKNEVAVELALPSGGEEKGAATTNGHVGGTKSRANKGAGAQDQLVEMRFYIPGTVKREKKEGEDEVENEDESEEQSAASLLYSTLIEKAEIGDVAGDSFANFQDILHLTPRGRFDIDLYEKSFRLRGKTYDYKINYESIKKFLLLPKPDDVHQLITMGLDPPLRQGQTRYPFLVMQFKKDEDIALSMNMTEESLEKYNGKLNASYDAPVANVVAQIFRGLSGRKITTPSKDFVSHHQQSGVKCSIKANEGHLYCLDKSFMFVPKPATYISFENIQVITMSRVGGAVSASRTFDITITMKGGTAEHQFSNINREEQTPLEEFFKIKNLKTKNEMADDSGALLAAALKNENADFSDDDDDAEAGGVRGSADEDDESVDEDFQEDSESDVAEEFDSDHESSGGGTDDEMEDVDENKDNVDKNDNDKGTEKAKKGKERELVERPKKKTKTNK